MVCLDWRRGERLNRTVKKMDNPGHFPETEKGTLIKILTIANVLMPNKSRQSCNH